MVYRNEIDVIVAGAGLVGCLCARAVARTGARVLVVDRASDPRHSASVAAAGMLAPQMEAAEGLLTEARGTERAMLDLCLAARERFPGIVDVLVEESGMPIEYGDEGTLVIALSDERAEELERQARAQKIAGLDAQLLTPEEARRLEPRLVPDLRGALLLPNDHRVDNVDLLRAALAAARETSGVTVAFDTELVGVVTAGKRVEATRLLDGSGMRSLSAPWVVVAAGAWSGAIAGLPAPLPVRPVKGQIVALDGASIGLRHTVGGPGAYAVPRADGRILLGATVEEVGFDRTVDPESSRGLEAAAATYVPALGEADRIAAWAGLRPGTPDALPILGPDPDVGGIVYATGHYRNGILLAPLTAEIVAAIVAGTEPPIDWEPFSRGREGLASLSPE